MRTQYIIWMLSWLLLSQVGFGQTLLCSVESDSLHSTTDTLVLQIKVRESPQSPIEQITLIDLGFEHLNEPHPNVLYARNNRGGFLVGYCNPNRNEYSPHTQKYSIHSHCMGKESVREILYSVKASLFEKGSLEYIAFFHSGPHEKRIIELEPCSIPLN